MLPVLAGLLDDPARRRGLAGIALAVGATLTFTASTVAAVFSYEGGGGPLAAISARYAGAMLVFVPLLHFTGVGFALPRRERLISLALGGLAAIQAYCLYTSIAHIAVGLTFAIFYIYPILVALLAIAFRQDRITPAIAVGLVVAFAGLILVFDATGQGSNLWGSLLAIGAAISWSILVVASGGAMRTQDPRLFTFHLQISAGLIYLAICLVAGDIALPQTAKGWAGLIALPLFYAVSMLGFFGAIALIGSIRASLLMNLEPVFAIAAGFLILGQVLTPLQLAGAALVIGAVLAVRIEKARPGAREADSS